MRVLIFPADNAGCGYYRLMFAAEHLKSLGHDIIIKWPDKDAVFEVYMEGDTPTDFVLPEKDVDVIVMQRISHELHVKVLPLMRSRGIATVIDMDDNLSAIHRDNVAYWNYHPRNIKTPFSWKHSEQVCREATMVTVSTQSLLSKYAAHGRGMVIDNYIPERYLDVMPMQEDEDPIFGWAGTVQSHPADLQVCGKAIQTLMDQGHRFRIVGPGKQAKENLRLNQEPESTGVVSLFNWPNAIAELSVGMAPLEMSTFNTSKSRLKPLEFNSVGVPYVISPRQEYRKYHKDSGAGLMADTPKEWISCISQLMTNESMRKELSEQGRAFAATQTVEEHSWRWLEAWTRAHDIAQGRGK